MRIATWNINSVRARTERALDVLDRWDLEVLLLQETKCRPDQFPVDAFAAAGYEVAAAGLNQWNGVAIISRVGISEVQTQFPGQPAFAKQDASGALLATPVVEPRAIGARVGGTEKETGIEVWSIYVPNGRAYGDPHFHYKLEFLEKLNTAVKAELAARPQARILLGGDWNVAPEDTDVWDPELFAQEIKMYTSAEERAAFHAFGQSQGEAPGLVELSRQASGAQYTFWDYQRLRFPKNHGMRIDFAWASQPLAQDFSAAWIDREERKGKGASDHVPVILEFT